VYNSYIFNEREKNMNKQVIIPQSDLDALEEARKQLCEIIEAEMKKDWIKGGKLLTISGFMWTLTHKRYEEAS